MNARFPHKNVTDIAHVALADTHENDKYTEMVLSPPSVDISNMDTSNISPNDNTEAFKQNVIISCKNIFTVAENALRNHQNLEKVVIIEHPPRFDRKETDPLGLKPHLARYANMIFGQLWLSSPLKDKIMIGSHCLGHTNTQIIKLYRNERTNRFDGVHMYSKHGRHQFTKSLIHILKTNTSDAQPTISPNQTPIKSHTKCPQAKYQEEKKKTTFTQQPHSQLYNVAVSNKFNVLGN